MFVKIILIAIFIFLGALGITTYFLFFHSNKEKLPGNQEQYAVANTKEFENAPLKGKTIIFLGSSVVYGSESLGESFVEYLKKKDGIIAIKEAVSGTTLVNQDAYGRKPYIERLKTIDSRIHADLFVCQLSTNDATMKKPLGEISSSYSKDSFDIQTITGAMEYIIAYAKETWNCGVVFFTGTKYTSLGHKQYAKMVERLHALQEKWNIGVLDFWNDTEMQSISKEDYTLYMANGIHPTKAGYREWWTPKFEKYLEQYLLSN